MLISIDLGAHQKSLSATLPLSILSNTLSVELSSYATTAALKDKQGTRTASLPLSISAAGLISIDLGAYQKTLSATLPLSISNNTLSVDLNAYQQKLIAYPPHSLTDTTMSMGGVDLIVPTLIHDMTGYATTDDL